MHKVTIYIYKAEMAALLNLVHPPSRYSLQSALNSLSLEELTLLEWRGRITQHNLLTWQLRDNQRKYGLNMPVTVALWKVLRNVPLHPDLQTLSDALDYCLISNGFSPNYLTVPYHD